MNHNLIQFQRPRKIIHLDMDCFYAAVEMRERPELRTKPIAIGSAPPSRGVLCTANYLARSFGVKSAQSSHLAQKLCPNLVFVRPRFSLYKKVSEQIRDIFLSYTELVQMVSLDEAYLDVTQHPNLSATEIAKQIRAKVFEETQLTVSAGVGPNKLIAKIASDWNKPNGLTIVPPEKVLGFITPLSLKKIPGIGKVTFEKLKTLGLHTCADVQMQDRKWLRSELGRFGEDLFHQSFGIHHSEVRTDWERKSLGHESTFQEDLTLKQDVVDHLPFILSEIERRYSSWIQKKERTQIPEKVYVKFKTSDHRIKTLERKVPMSFFHELFTHHQFQSEEKLFFEEMSLELWDKVKNPIRLLGAGIRFRCPDERDEQLSLFQRTRLES